MNALLTGTHATVEEARTFLQATGWDVIHLPLIATVSVPRRTWEHEALTSMGHEPHGTCIVTSKRAAADLSLLLAEHALPRGWNVMAVGEETGRAFHATGVPLTVIANGSTAAASLASAACDFTGTPVLLVGARLMDMGLADAVRGHGGIPHHVVTYDTTTPGEAREALRTLSSTTVDLGIFWSASAARAFASASRDSAAPTLSHAVAMGVQAAAPLEGIAPRIHTPTLPTTQSLLTLLTQLTQAISTASKEHA